MATRQITVRLDEDVFRQISARAQIINTPVSAEISKLLIWALDKQVEMDQDLLKKMHVKLASSRPRTSGAAAQPAAPEKPRSRQQRSLVQSD